MVQRKFKNQKFFHSVDFEKLNLKEYEPPFVPEIDFDKLNKIINHDGVEIGVVRTPGSKHREIEETYITTENRRLISQNRNNFSNFDH